MQILNKHYTQHRHTKMGENLVLPGPKGMIFLRESKITRTFCGVGVIRIFKFRKEVRRVQTLAEVVFFILWHVWLIRLKHIRRIAMLWHRWVNSIRVMRAIGVQNVTPRWTDIFLFATPNNARHFRSFTLRNWIKYRSLGCLILSLQTLCSSFTLLQLPLFFLSCKQLLTQLRHLI